MGEGIGKSYEIDEKSLCIWNINQNNDNGYQASQLLLPHQSASASKNHENIQTNKVTDQILN